ncbi:MAG: hypothetical protein RLZZ368_747, partial [Actinomycetota bacterium]
MAQQQILERAGCHRSGIQVTLMGGAAESQ